MWAQPADVLQFIAIVWIYVNPFASSTVPSLEKGFKVSGNALSTIKLDSSITRSETYVSRGGVKLQLKMLLRTMQKALAIFGSAAWASGLDDALAHAV